MREIKFKIWDSTNNVMITENNSEGIIEKFMDTSADYKQCEWFPVCNIDVPFLLNNLEKDKILLEYTGLKDKNGVDIYEGDIVIFNSGLGGYEENEIYYDEVNLMFNMKSYNENKNATCFYYDGLYNLHHKENVEVIGNIYENKELLGDKQCL